MALKNIGIAGCLGRMGQELVKETINNKNLNFIGGFEQPQHENIHKKISEFISVRTDQIISDDPKKIFSDSDVVIDFTTPQSTLKNILIATEQNTALVVGTTGLNDKIMNEIKKASEKISILQSSNMSVGANLLFHLVQRAASTLQDNDYDIEIAETHHKHKIDAPSGTAIILGESAAKGRKKNINEIKVFDRINSTTKREKGSIGFAVTRGGEIAGEHTVSFLGTNDRVDLIHKAHNRSIFVKGAIEAAIFISNKKNGLYTMEDVINSK
jgi:4-hydroxy-tetrahydrodipicolinate reductase